MADALSRDPFTSISKRLIQEPYSNLVQEADGAEADRVQDALRVRIQHLHMVQQTEPAPVTIGSCSSSEVKAALLYQSAWKDNAETRPAHFSHHVQQLQPPDYDTLPSLTLHEMEDHQHQDPIISSILPFVVCKTREAWYESQVAGHAEAMGLTQG